MKSLFLFAILSFFCWSTKEVNAQTNATSALAVRFDGRTPCQALAQSLNAPVNSDCFKLKWSLTLYQDANMLTPTTYKLEGTLYRKKVREGKWSIISGAKMNPNAIVYQLVTDNPQETLYLMKADENILYFLDKDRNLLVGDHYFSYTLNRRTQQ